MTTTRDEHTGLMAVDAEPNWRAIAFKHEELGKNAHWLANAVERRDKAKSEMATASESIIHYDSKITALQAELIELEAAK